MLNKIKWGWVIIIRFELSEHNFIITFYIVPSAWLHYNSRLYSKMNVFNFVVYHAFLCYCEGRLCSWGNKQSGYWTVTSDAFTHSLPLSFFCFFFVGEAMQLLKSRLVLNHGKTIEILVLIGLVIYLNVYVWLDKSNYIINIFH